MPRLGLLDTTPLGQLVSFVTEKIHMPTPLPFYVTLGAAVGTHTMTHLPVWLMHVGGSGTGKSLMLSLVKEIVRPDGTPVMHELGSPTGVAAFLTSRRKTDKRRGSAESKAHITGGLLNLIGQFGVITSKDFTSILEKEPKIRGEIISALREIYDGEWDRPTGGEGGESLSWGPGKCGFIGCVTNVIDQYWMIISKLGDRWVYLRHPQVTSESMRMAVLYAMQNEQFFVKPYAEGIRDYLRELGLKPGLKIDDGLSTHDIDRIYEMAVFLCFARINVPRNQFNKKDFDMPQIEGPTRSSAALRNIYAGMIWAGVSKTDAWKGLYRIVIDSIPAVRGRIITLLLANGNKGYATQLADLIPCGIPTVGFALDDLRMADIVEEYEPTAGTTENGTRGESRIKYWRLTNRSLKVLNRVANFITSTEEQYDSIELDLD